MNKLGNEIVNAIWDTNNVDPSKLHDLARNAYDKIVNWFDEINPKEIRVFVSKTVCKKYGKTEESFINHIKTGELRFVESSKVESIFNKIRRHTSTKMSINIGYQTILYGTDEYLFLNAKDVLMIIQKLS